MLPIVLENLIYNYLHQLKLNDCLIEMQNTYTYQSKTKIRSIRYYYHYPISYLLINNDLIIKSWKECFVFSDKIGKVEITECWIKSEDDKKEMF